MGVPELADLIKRQMSRPNPIREIMKMADRRNIINMGLNPDEVISYSGGWVNHDAPDALRQTYVRLCGDHVAFHKSGGYTATIGDYSCREAIAGYEREIFGAAGIKAENIIIGQSSTQITHDMLRTLANPDSTIMLLDPTYANYPGQINFALPGAKITTLRVFEPETWEYIPDAEKTIEQFREIFFRDRPKIILIPSPDNPTSLMLDERVMREMLDVAAENNCFLVLDHAYKCQYFGEAPSYFSWSPNEYENLVTLHSNSKWSRSLGRRLGWMEAHPEVIAAMERTQQISILCPDTLHQMALTEYLDEALSDGSLRKYIDQARRAYRKAAERTISAIDAHLGMRRTVPDGGLYTVIDVGSDGDEFVIEVLKNTGVLFIPGGGFGSSLKNGVRVSYGPLVNDPAKIDEGFERVGEFLRRKTG